MRWPLLIKNPIVGYGLAAVFYLIAVGLFFGRWMFLGTFFATLAVVLTIDVAAAHKHFVQE